MLVKEETLRRWTECYVERFDKVKLWEGDQIYFNGDNGTIKFLPCRTVIEWDDGKVEDLWEYIDPETMALTIDIEVIGNEKDEV